VECRKNHRDWVTEAHSRADNIRDNKWTESIAVGIKTFVEHMKEDFGMCANGRKTIRSKDVFQLQETLIPYNADFDTKKSAIGSKNKYS